MDNLKSVKCDNVSCNMPCISWGAILLGALTAIALGFLTNLFALAIGLTAFPATPSGREQFAVFGFVCLVILAVISMFISGWVAGFLGKYKTTHNRCLGELYGFGAWALALVLTLFLASNGNQFLLQRSYLVDRNINPVHFTNQIASDVNQARNLVTTTPPSPETAEASTTLGAVTFVTFFILFIGALSSAWGGYVGMRYNRRCHINCTKCCVKTL